MKKETIIVIAIAGAIIVGNWLFLGSRGSEEMDIVEGTEGAEIIDDMENVANNGGLEVLDLDNSTLSAPPISPTNTLLPTPPSSLATGPILTPSASTVTAADQPAGNSVQIANLALDRIAWVVIYEDREGTPWNILGAQRLRPTNSSGTVDLLRNTAVGGIYYAILHIDDGDDTFDYQKDIQMKSTTGGIIMSRFVTQSLPSIEEALSQ